MPIIRGSAKFKVNVRSKKDLAGAREKIIAVLKKAGITTEFQVTIDEDGKS